MTNPDEIRNFYSGMIVISRPTDQPTAGDGDSRDHELWTCQEVSGNSVAGDVTGKDSEGRPKLYRPVEKLGTFHSLGAAIRAAKLPKAADQPAAQIPPQELQEEDTEILPE